MQPARGQNPGHMAKQGERHMITIQQMVDREVQVCLSSLVATLAVGDNTDFMRDTMHGGLPSLCEQAFELASPVPDYEEAAIQAGYDFLPSKDKDCLDMVLRAGGEVIRHYGNCGESANTVAARHFSGDPIDREVYEHWSVSQWLAEKLQAQGEKVDLDFAGLCVWARTTTGQAIHADGVIERIYAAMTAPTPPAEHLASIRETLKDVAK